VPDLTETAVAGPARRDACKARRRLAARPHLAVGDFNELKYSEI